MTCGRFPSVAALTVSARSGPPSKDHPAFPPPAQPLGCLQAGFLWIAVAGSTALLSTTFHQPPFPHGLEYPLGSPMCCVFVHPGLQAGGQPFPRSPEIRSRINPRVLRPLSRRPHGEPSPPGTPHGRPGVQGIFLTFRGQAPHGWPMVHHSMATGFPIPWGCRLALGTSSPSPALSRRPVPHAVFIPQWAASNPLARTHCILLHPGTFSFSLQRSLVSNPLFPCVGCFLLSSPGCASSVRHVSLPMHWSRPPFLDSSSHPVPHPVFIPHRPARNPVTWAQWLLIHPRTVSCS